MSRILIIYGTTEGHTAKVSRVIADQLHLRGVDADLFEAGTADPMPAFYDAVIVAGSIHAGGYQKALCNWVREHVSDLRLHHTAFVSVCLGILSKSQKSHADLAAIVDRFGVKTGWKPPVVKFVAGALPYTKYNFFTRWIMKRIAAAEGGDTDTSRDYEYTDWQDVRDFADRFAGRVKPQPIPAAGAA